MRAGIMVVALLGSLGLGGCTPEVHRRPAQLGLTEETGPTIEMLRDVVVAVGSGHWRTIERGRMWTRVGRLGEGEVYKPVEHVFTVQGARTHEAWLVIGAEDRVVGFYLPRERAYAPAPDGPSAPLSIRKVR